MLHASFYPDRDSENWDADVGYEQEYGARGGYFEGVQQPFEIMVSFPVRL